MPTGFVRARATKRGVRRYQVLYRVGGRGSSILSAGVYPTRDEAESVLEVIMLRIAAGQIVDENAPKVVYFAEFGGLVKIGISRRPEERVRSMNARLLAVKSGGRQLERQLHACFADLRETGEWFRDHPDLRAYMADETRLIDQEGAA